jgi:hypothetical protein
MKDTPRDHGLKVTGGGEGLVGHAGAVLLRELADRVGFTAALGSALAGREVPAGGQGCRAGAGRCPDPGQDRPGAGPRARLVADRGEADRVPAAGHRREAAGRLAGHRPGRHADHREQRQGAHPPYRHPPGTRGPDKTAENRHDTIVTSLGRPLNHRGKSVPWAVVAAGKRETQFVAQRVGIPYWLVAGRNSEKTSLMEVAVGTRLNQALIWSSSSHLLTRLRMSSGTLNRISRNSSSISARP